MAPYFLHLNRSVQCGGDFGVAGIALLMAGFELGPIFVENLAKLS